ncbi:MAG: penicillin-binding protein 2 [Candidatus Omnitrophota bacterium]|jgi:penicillin-binding protein 2
MSRVRILAIGFMVFYALLFLGLFKMQIIDYAHFHKLSEKNRVRPIILEAPRGIISDRNGQTIVSNRLSFDCYILPRAIDLLSDAFGELSFLLSTDIEVLRKNYKKNTWSPFRPVLIAQDISKENAIRIEESSDELAGVFIKTSPVREYHLGSAMAHVTGYVGAINAGEYKQMKTYGYRRQDQMGRAGVEKTYDSYLRGKHGAQQFEVDNRGRLLRVLRIQEQERGESIELTIDAELQQLAQRLLGGRKGAITMMELTHGGIISMFSGPSYDPNVFVTPLQNSKSIRDILTDKKHRLMNRAVAGVYPPGSTYKIISALAALEAGKVNTKTQFFCPGVFSLGGFRFKCWYKEGHGAQNIYQSLEHSCNIFFYNAGLKTGVRIIEKMSKKFGLGQKTGIDLPQENAGLLPGPSWKRSTMKKSWYAGETVNLSIGQGYLLTTPLQMVLTAAAIATGGTLFKPFVVSRISDVDVSPKSPQSIDVSKKSMDIIKEGMRLVVESKTGTGQRVKNPVVRIAGKTGTAQAPHGDDHAWFIGYAPIDNPQAAISVVVENGGGGGVVAAPIAKELFEYMQTHGYFV